MKNLLKKIPVIMLAFVMAFSCLVGCDKTREADQTLEVFIKNDGYGIEGVKATLYAFAEQDWVKEKYPNLVIPTPVDEKIANYGINKISAPKKNNFDLVFETADFYQFFGKNTKGESTLVDLTEVVYNSLVPNENVKVKDKMKEENYRYSAYTPNYDNPEVQEFYDMGWCVGYSGIVYNPEIVERYVAHAPRTTDELLDLTYRIKNGLTIQAKPNNVTLAQWNLQNSGNASGYSFVPCGTAVYEDVLYPSWWAQYDGIGTYQNFWQGVYEEDGDLSYSNKIFDELGRLKAMEVEYEILNFQNKYYDLEKAVEDYIIAQRRLLYGEYAMTFCADWFDSEMKPTREAMMAEVNANVPGAVVPKELYVLKTPIVSDIVEKLGQYNGGQRMTDEQLSFIIDLIDNRTIANDTAAYEAVRDAFTAQYPTAGTLSRKDYNKLVEARSIYPAAAFGHTVCIPSVSNSIDVAIDYLRFMATDVAQLAYMVATEGQNMPYDFDPNSTEILYGTNKTVAEAYQEAFANFSPMQQTRHKVYFNTLNEPISLESTVRNRLAKAGLKGIIISGTLGKEFRNETSRTPQQLFNDTKSQMTDSAYTFLLFEAGLVNSYQ